MQTKFCSLRVDPADLPAQIAQVPVEIPDDWSGAEDKDGRIRQDDGLKSALERSGSRLPRQAKERKYDEAGKKGATRSVHHRQTPFGIGSVFRSLYL